MTDFDIEQHSGGYLNRSNFPESVHRRRTEDIAMGMRLARLFYEVNPGAINADRAKTREVVQALVNGINDARFALFAAGKVELANTLAEIEILAKSQLQIEPTP